MFKLFRSGISYDRSTQFVVHVWMLLTVFMFVKKRVYRIGSIIGLDKNPIESCDSIPVTEAAGQASKPVRITTMFYVLDS